MIDFSYSHLLFGTGILAIILVRLKTQKRSFWYLLFFSMFWIYLLFVLGTIIFPIAPLPKIYRDEFRLSINLIPFYFGACDPWDLCLRNIVGNILLTVPFGLGVSFITGLRWKDFIWLSPSVGLVFEGLQLMIALLFRSAFRVVDINDVILNTLGVWLGYLLFRMFGSFYLFVTKRFEIQDQSLSAYIYEVVHQSQ
jgi:glycopeptide antibiotics resistance protein